MFRSLIALILFLAAPALAESGPALVTASGVKGGVVVQVGNVEGSSPGDLLVSERYVVQALFKDPAAVQAARKAVGAKGQYGKVSVRAWNGKQPLLKRPSRRSWMQDIARLIWPVVERPLSARHRWATWSWLPWHEAV